MKTKLDVEIIRKGKLFLARAPGLNIVTRGSTAAEARKKLKELVKVRFLEMKKRGTLENFLQESASEE